MPAMGVDKPKLPPGLGGRLRTLRGTRTLDEVALALSTHRPTVHRWETGQREPSLLDLCRLADFYGVTTDYLLGRKAKGR